MSSAKKVAELSDEIVKQNKNKVHNDVLFCRNTHLLWTDLSFLWWCKRL